MTQLNFKLHLQAWKMFSMKTPRIGDVEEESEQDVLDGFGSGYFPALTPC